LLAIAVAAEGVHMYMGWKEASEILNVIDTGLEIDQAVVTR